MEEDVAGRLLSQARAQAGWSQSHLARIAGEPQSVVNAYERGRRQPGVAALVRLVRAAGYDLALVPRAHPSSTELEQQAGRRLPELLALAEQLPRRRRADRLDFPRLPAA
jgi:transcriptional regulator with XRE-family HTH domain